MIQRLSAQYLRFDGTESFSTTKATGTSLVPGTGGVLVYSKAVFAPFSSGPQTLYVTLSAIGDDHGGQPNYMSCNVDAPGGVPTAASQVCNPTPTTKGVDTAPPGWLTLAHHFDYDISEYVSVPRFKSFLESQIPGATCHLSDRGLEIGLPSDFSKRDYRPDLFDLLVAQCGREFCTHRRLP